MDLSKYRTLFLEEAREHLGQLSDALLALEKQPEASAEIDVAFRMAHSIKGMAASLDYEAIAELSHRLEDRLSAARSAGRVAPDGLALLFEGLEVLERMVAGVESDAPPLAADPALLAGLAAAEPVAAAVSGPAAEPPKKAPRRR